MNQSSPQNPPPSQNILSGWRARFAALPRGRKILIVAAVALAVVVVATLAGGNGGKVPTVTATRGSVSRSVSVTGSLTPVDSVELAFAAAGRVASVPAQVGDRVQAGQVLATLDNNELLADLRDAEATVQVQQARLDELRRGTRTEELAAKEAELKQAQQELADAYQDAEDVLLDAFVKAANAVRIQTLGVYESTGSQQAPMYRLTFSCACDQQVRDAISARVSAEVALNRWKAELDALAKAGTPDAMEVALENARGYLNATRDALARTEDVLNATGAVLDAATLAEERANINEGKASIASALSITAAQAQVIDAQRFVVERIAQEFALKQSGSAPEVIAAQEATLQSAQARADRIRALIAKNIIRSPIRGIVTRADAKVGQTAQASEVLMSVISDADLEVEAQVPEVDIGQVMVGSPVAVMVDAIPGEQFPAAVVAVDPGETILDGVVNFKVTAALEEGDPRLRSGMTADLEIRGEHHDDVIVVPRRAVLEDSQGATVRRLEGSNESVVPVVLGLLGSDGLVEVVSGLSEGDVLVDLGAVAR